MLDEKDMKDLYKLKRLARMRELSEDKGYVRVPREGMKLVRKKILAMKDKVVEGKTVKDTQCTTAMLVFDVILEHTFQENNQEGKRGACSYTNWKDNCTYVSFSGIADEIGRSRKVVEFSIAILIEAGVLVTRYRLDRKLNRYRYFMFPVFNDNDDELNYISERCPKNHNKKKDVSDKDKKGKKQRLKAQEIAPKTFKQEPRLVNPNAEKDALERSEMQEFLKAFDTKTRGISQKYDDIMDIADGLSKFDYESFEDMSKRFRKDVRNTLDTKAIRLFHDKLCGYLLFYDGA